MLPRPLFSSQLHFRFFVLGIFSGLIFGVWFSVGQARSFRRDSFQPSRGKKQEGKITKIKKSKIDLLVVLLRLGVRVAPLHDGLRVRLASRERALVALLSDFIEGANELLSTKYSVQIYEMNNFCIS